MRVYQFRHPGLFTRTNILTKASKLDNLGKNVQLSYIMEKLLLLASFFIVAPLFLLFNLLFFSYLSYHKNQPYFQSSLFQPTKTVAYAALPSIQNVFHYEIGQKDSRVESIREFFARYNSPLKGHAQDVIDAAEKYGLDYRLIPAIAMQESNLCKKIPKNSYNCWGYGIYGKQVKNFDNYTQAIDTVTKTLAKHYKGNGLETPEQIMTKYTPSNNGAWARSVSYFMNQL